ncbi:putative leucine-rich repeat-containing protein DDB_G0290503 [Centruroides vittatus]|uniref:putative leucine-rich repeat-containing protein DDB_G0290503 n=1 Tax=Centruroides vittatus TaxID=120091 RepID=UPI00350F53C6
MTKTVEESIISLETAVLNETKDLEKNLQAEKQKILHLQNEYNILQKETEKTQEAITKLDEQTREVYRKFTSSREKCNDLKQLMQCIENHENELNIKLTNEIEKGKYENLQYSQALDVYQNKWNSYQEIYEQHPLIPTLRIKQQQLKESEENLQKLQSHLKELENEFFRKKCNIKSKTADNVIYYDLKSYIIELSKLKKETFDNQKNIMTIHNEIQKLTNIAKQKQYIILNSTSNEMKQSKIASQSVSSYFQKSIQNELQTKTVSFQTPKLKFYIPQFSSTPRLEQYQHQESQYHKNYQNLDDSRSCTKMTPDHVPTSQQFDNSNQNIVIENKLASSQTSKEDNFQRNESLENQTRQNSSETSSIDFEFDRETSFVPSIKSPGFSYNSRFMFTPNKANERSDKNFDLSLGPGSFQTPNYQDDSGISQQAESLSLPTKTNDQSSHQLFLFAQSPSTDDNPLYASVSLNNSSVFSLFANPEGNNDNTAILDTSNFALISIKKLHLTKTLFNLISNKNLS